MHKVRKLVKFSVQDIAEDVFKNYKDLFTNKLYQRLGTKPF
jgi:hypothetical protein